jgi:hypothetical protein
MEHQSRSGNCFYDPASDTKATLKEFNSSKKIGYFLLAIAIGAVALFALSVIIDCTLSHVGPPPWVG